MASRHRRALAIAMVDIDNFKGINDSYGHPFGDLVLQRLAAVLEQTARTTDVVCRYGGEEFAIILRETTAETASRAAERLREAVAGLVFHAKGRSVSVTASFGIAELQLDAVSSAKETLVSEADAALYVAKQRGRNRVALLGHDT